MTEMDDYEERMQAGLILSGARKLGLLRPQADRQATPERGRAVRWVLRR